MQLDWYILHGTGNRYGTITGFKVNCGFKMSRCENHHSWPESKRWHNSSSVCSVKIVTQTSRMSSYHMCYCFILRGGGVCYRNKVTWLIHNYNNQGLCARTITAPFGENGRAKCNQTGLNLKEQKVWEWDYFLHGGNRFKTKEASAAVVEFEVSCLSKWIGQ